MADDSFMEGLSGTWVKVSGDGNDVAKTSETGMAEPEPGPAVEHGPLGPRNDPVFPSLPSAEESVEPAEVFEANGVPVAAVPLSNNIFTLTPIPSGSTREDLLEEAKRLATAPLDQRLGEFDQPEKERIFGIAKLFVHGHVRRISKGAAIKTAQESFGIGTIVISEDLVPETRLRHAKFQWAVTPSGFVELKNAKLPVGHLELLEVGAQPMYGSPHRGDDSDVAFLLAYLCDLMGTSQDQSVAGVGVIALEDDHLLVEPAIEALLDGARTDHIANVILPLANAKMNGEHDGVRYWSARDSNEVVFSLFTALAHKVVVPNLHRRAMTKEAYSWFSLVTILLAVCGFQLAVAFGDHPPVEFLRFLLGVVILLMLGSLVFTHLYLRRAR
jgi:hypothetical protein